MNQNLNLTAKISNGFGNQMFLYASSYAFSKKMRYNLLIDIKTGIESLKKIHKKKKFKHYDPKFELDIFNLSAKKADNDLCFDGLNGYIKKKIFIILDKFKKKKRFIKEIKNNSKKTFFYDSYLNNEFTKNVYIEGYFESEKYFKEYKKDLLNEFSFVNKIKCNSSFLDKINSSNSVSIAIRRDRYSEFIKDDSDKEKIKKTLDFENSQYQYVKRSIEYVKKKISNPKFFLFSDNFDGLENIFNKSDDLIFINNHLRDKTIEDFYLMYKCKHFIVAPTSFHWWSAWLNPNTDKICIRPKDINPSNNIDFWPESWTPL